MLEALSSIAAPHVTLIWSRSKASGGTAGTGVFGAPEEQAPHP
jgi:hypothetical protein